MIKVRNLRSKYGVFKLAQILRKHGVPLYIAKITLL